VAERGHTSQRTLERLNPMRRGRIAAGTEVILPDCGPVLNVRAASLRIALARREITAFAADGSLIALFPVPSRATRSAGPRANCA
jgi:hypothetical protein